MVPWKSGALSAASPVGAWWASAPVAPLGLKAVADSVKNAALKGCSSTVQEVSVEPEDWRLI
jgi:hypothetical protein